MKTTDPRDPLDQDIDSLLESRTLKPDPGFTNRVMAAFDAEVQQASVNNAPDNQASRMAPVLKFALPIAAAIVLALTLAQFSTTQASPTTSVSNLTAAEAQEIFLLEDGLEAISALSDDSFESGDLLSTLDALTFEIES